MNLEKYECVFCMRNFFYWIFINSLPAIKKVRHFSDLCGAEKKSQIGKSLCSAKLRNGSGLYEQNSVNTGIKKHISIGTHM